MANILIITGSVYGGAQFVAEQAEELLQQNHQVTVTDSPSVADINQSEHDTFLVVSSTTGQGDLPENLVPFYTEARDQLPLISEKRYGVIALGDKSYGDTYCAGGRMMDELFTELQAAKLGERLDIDACEVLQPEDEAMPWLEEWQQLL